MALAQETRLQQNLQMEPGMERPQSALSRGVQITEFKDARVNPEPVVLEETDLLLEQFLSPRKLMMLTGVDNLDDIRHLEMKVNTSDTSLGNFGQLLVNLKRLKVSNSTIPRIRDLGSSLRALHVLWASRCSLVELDGISSICNLRELYLSYNEISDINPISMLDQIEILDLEGNNIDDIIQVQYLGICTQLTNLTLDGNPVCNAPTADDDTDADYDYRQAVKKAIPHLKTLDDELLIEGVGSFQKHNVFDADWAYLEELQKDIGLQEEDSDSLVSDTSRPSSGQRPSTAALRPNTGYRPGSALRPSSGFRPMTAKARPASSGPRPATAIGMRPGSSSGRPSSGGNEPTEVTGDGSDLTLGKIICGNPSKALLSRRRLNPDATGELDNDQPDIEFKPNFKTEHTYDSLPEEERDRSEIVDELKTWKLQHEQRMAKIQEGKVAQVLTINHDEADDAVSLSGDDSEVDSDEEFSPLRHDSNNDHIQMVRAENHYKDGNDTNLSSFVPVNEPGHSSHVPHILQESSDSKPHHSSRSPQPSSRHVSHGDDEEGSLLRSSDNAFNISHFAGRNKTVIPPPSERDIVRKHIDTSSQVRAQSPLGSLLSQSPLPGARPDSRTRSAIKVNSTGLPPKPWGAGAPVIGRLKSDYTSPVIKAGSSFDRPVPPPSQRPVTARAALGISGQPKIRRSLPTVPPLPSKPTAPPK